MTVRLEDSRRVLELFAEAFADRPVPLSVPADAGSDEAQIARTSNGESIVLPEEFPGDAGDLSIYELAILHQIGLYRWNSLGVSLAARRPAASLGGIAELGRRFDSYAVPRLGAWLYAVLEAARIDALLSRRYPGLGPVMARAMARALAERGEWPQEPLLRFCEAVLRWSLGSRDWPYIPTTARRIEAAMPDVGAPLRDPSGSLAGVDRLLSVLASDRELAAMVGPGADAALRWRAAWPAELALVDYRGAVDVRAIEEQALRLAIRLDLAAEESLEAREELDQGLGLLLIVDADFEGEGERSRGPIDAGEGNAGSYGEDFEPGAPESAAVAADREAAPPTRRRRHRREFRYDEWDCVHRRYLERWCRLEERPLQPAPIGATGTLRRDERALFAEIRDQLLRLRPEVYRRVRGLTDGEDIDLDAAIEAHVDRLAGAGISERVYTRRQRQERDVAAAFLIDMSASTDTPVPEEGAEAPAAAAAEPRYVGIFDDDPFWAPGPGAGGGPRRRVIDIEREAMVLMAEALQELGDAYAVFGFSGYGRDNVEFYVAKDFGDVYDDAARGRIAAIEPKRSTRMGPAIRHSLAKLRAQDARLKALLVLSDGYPQDCDYGPDRTSREYGIRDTTKALEEAEAEGVHTFCITVDPAGHDYLREMFPDDRYLVLEEVAALPRELPKVYRSLTA